MLVSHGLHDGALARGRALLSEARRVVVLTGAGISAESGVPTFRGAEGMWRSFRPEELATPDAFARDPRLVWEWYGWRRALVAACTPNAAHLVLARVAIAREGSMRIVTQNVDGLHVRAAREVAGSRDPSCALPLELHGALDRARCSRCGWKGAHGGPVDATSTETLPRCVSCAGLLRPDVVWFGESLSPDVLGAAAAAARGADVCLVIGTSAVVQPAASLAGLARESGARIVEVNPNRTPVTDIADVSLRSTAVQAVPLLLAEQHP